MIHMVYVILYKNGVQVNSENGLYNVSLDGEYRLEFWDEDPNNDDYLFSIFFESRSSDLNYYNSQNGDVILSFIAPTSEELDAYFHLNNSHDFYNQVLDWNGPDNENKWVTIHTNISDEFMNLRVRTMQCSSI